MKDRLFRLAYGIVRDREEAEDILQDMLLKMWSRKEDWKDIGNLEAYCFRAIKNMALDRMATMALRKTDATQHYHSLVASHCFLPSQYNYHLSIRMQNPIQVTRQMLSYDWSGRRHHQYSA